MRGARDGRGLRAARGWARRERRAARWGLPAPVTTLGRCGRSVPSLPRVFENVAASLVVLGLIALWGVVVVWLATSGADPVTLRLWMLVVAAALFVTVLAWLIWLTLRVRSLGREPAVARRPFASSPARGPAGSARGVPRLNRVDRVPGRAARLVVRRVVQRPPSGGGRRGSEDQWEDSPRRSERPLRRRRDRERRRDSDARLRQVIAEVRAARPGQPHARISSWPIAPRFLLGHIDLRDALEDAVAAWLPDDLRAEAESLEAQDRARLRRLIDCA